MSLNDNLPVREMKTTYSSMFLSFLMQLVRGQPQFGMRPEDSHFTSTGSCFYFVDPADKQRYRVTVEPVWGNDKFDYTTSQAEHHRREMKG